MRRVNAARTGEGSKSKHLADIDSKALSLFPNLVQHCCVTRYDDDQPRRPGWWTVKTMGSAWMVEVKDPDSCCRIQATGNSVDEALTLAELLLGAEEAPWEPDPWMKQQAARGKKKDA